MHRQCGKTDTSEAAGITADIDGPHHVPVILVTFHSCHLDHPMPVHTSILHSTSGIDIIVRLITGRLFSSHCCFYICVIASHCLIVFWVKQQIRLLYRDSIPFAVKPLAVDTAVSLTTDETAKYLLQAGRISICVCCAIVCHARFVLCANLATRLGLLLIGPSNREILN